MKFTKSQELLSRARELIPNGTQTMSKCFNQWANGTAPNYIVSADGPYMWDVDGNKFVDMMGALGPIILGYNHPEVTADMIDQISRGSVFSLSCPIEVELAELLTEIIPSCEMMRFGKNGSDVTGIAVRVARSYTKKEHVLSPSGHYHGWCDFYAASSSLNSGLPECTKSLVENFTYNDLDSLKEKLETGRFAAVIMEPCRLQAPEKGFLEGVRDLCTKYGAILIFDEVVTSFRWSLGGAQQYYGVTPDISAIGKAMSNGMPISALVGKRDLINELTHGGVFFSGTFLGEAVSMAAAVATIKFLRANQDVVYKHIWEKGLAYKAGFDEHCKKIGLDAEAAGFGPLLNIKFNTDDSTGCKDLFCKKMIEQGFFTGTAVYITLAHTDDIIEQAIVATRNSLDAVSKAIQKNTIDAELGGQRSQPVFKNNFGKK